MKAIHAEPMPIKTILQNYEFVIPEYQRPYSWDKDQCAQLWEDLEAFLGGNENRYFLGSIVVCPPLQTEGAMPNEKVLSVIDGQQRLTTLLLLLKTMLNRVGTMSIISKMIYKLDPLSGDPMESMEPSLESGVQPGDGRDDRADFYKIMADDSESMDGKSPFKVNYQCLQDAFGEWLKGRNLGSQLENDIGRLLDKVTMLLIRCESEQDALTLFQTINDRGMPLGDADIFKAKIYREASAAGAEKQGDFIARWKEMKSHEDLFRIFMHISRADNDDTSKEIALRKYMENKHLGTTSELAGKWESIMDSLEQCHWIGTTDGSTVADGETADKEWIYWVILSQYPNVYWRYPLYVYLHKCAEWTNGKLSLPPEKNDEYIALMENTIRYFFTQGVLYNAVNTVKDATYRACAAIAHGRDYVAEYEKSVGVDARRMEEELDVVYLRRYRNGLVLLGALLNSSQCISDYAKVLRGNYDIEHVLPKRWRHYDGWTQNWDEDSVELHIDSPGNLVPLERTLNIQAANESFRIKKERYAESQVQDAKDLIALSHWRETEVEERQKKSVARLLKFFNEKFQRV